MRKICVEPLKRRGVSDGAVHAFANNQSVPCSIACPPSGGLKDFRTMTTVLSQKGQVVLPGPVREKLHLHAGDHFEVSIEDEDTITLRRISQPANRGLVDLLLACPVTFEIPARDAKGTLIP